MKVTFNFQIFYSRIDQVMKSCDCIFAEINQYNETYQSKFLLSVWTVFGTMMVMFAHMLIFSELDIRMKIFILYGMISQSSIFLPIIFAASSINHGVGMLSRNIGKILITLFKDKRICIKVNTLIKVIFLNKL